MPTLTFGERQGFSHISSHALKECVVPTFLMRRLPRLFANTPMGLLGEHRLIGLPKITVAGTLTKRQRNAMPQASTRSFTVIPKEKGQNVLRSAQQHRPQSSFVHACSHKTPSFIDFQHVIRLWGWKRLSERWQQGNFFFDPVRQCVPGHPEDAADAPHTGTFLICSEDFGLTFRAIRLFWGQDPNRAAVFAEILLIAALISSIFDDVCAAAFATLMLNRGHNHLTIFFEEDAVDKKIRASFKLYHYQTMVVVKSLMIRARTDILVCPFAVADKNVCATIITIFTTTQKIYP